MLSDKQMTAIDMIVAGRRLVDVEKDVEVSHSQLWKWRQDPAFEARLQDARAKYHEERRDRIWGLTDSAMDVVQETLKEGDPKTAMEVLRLLAAGLTDVRYVNAAPALPTPSETAALDVPKAYRCETCGKECKSAGGLATHRRGHEG